jgi:hypothetical protein
MDTETFSQQPEPRQGEDDRAAWVTPVVRRLALSEAEGQLASVNDGGEGLS